MSLVRDTKDLTPKNFLNQHQYVCGICYLPFNHTTQLPLIICENTHYVCSGCIRPLRRSKKCPFCRLPLLLDTLKIDHKTLEKIPNDVHEPNVRQQVWRAEYFQLSPEPSVLSESFEQQGFNVQMQQAFEMQRRIIMDETSRKRTIIYLCTIFFVLPVFILDSYFGYFYYSQPKCTDTTFLFGAVNLRTWLIIISFTEGVYLFILFLSYIKRKLGNLYQEFYLNSFEEIYSMGIMFKALVCSIIELVYFFGLVDRACSGPVYIYELTLACVHLAKLSAISAALIRNWCY